MEIVSYFSVPGKIAAPLTRDKERTSAADTELVQGSTERLFVEVQEALDYGKTVGPSGSVWVGVAHHPTPPGS